MFPLYTIYLTQLLSSLVTDYFSAISSDDEEYFELASDKNEVICNASSETDTLINQNGHVLKPKSGGD